jgi:hypothetical protein
MKCVMAKMISYLRTSNYYLCKLLKFCSILCLLSPSAWSSENAKLSRGSLVWTTRQADKIYILNDKKPDPSVLLDIPKTFGISEKLPTPINVVGLGKSVFWMDYDYSYGKNRASPFSILIYKIDVDSGKVSTLVNLAQDPTSKIRRWALSSLSADKTHLYFLGQDENSNSFIYSYDVTTRRLSMVFPLPSGTPNPIRMTTDGNSIYTHVEGALKNQNGGFRGLSIFLLKLKLDSNILSANDVIPALRAWSGVSNLYINSDDAIVTNGNSLFYTVSSNPRSKTIVRSDIEGSNPIMIFGGSPDSSVSSIAISTSSLFWAAGSSDVPSLVRIYKSDFDGSASALLATIPISDRFSESITSMAFVDNESFISNALMPIFLIIISVSALFIILRLLPKKGAEGAEN